jgi:hypothetical protein
MGGAHAGHRPSGRICRDDIVNFMNMLFKTGDWVEVKSPGEIAETLDASGTLDGLPFMPEMLPYCGRRFQVQRRAEKACIEYPGGYKIREFLRNDVLLLQELRCSGLEHDGCGRACMLFWKASWLRKVESGQEFVQVSPYREPVSKMRTTVAPDRYFCQSTELAKATQPFSRVRMLRKCLDEVRSGSRGVFEMLGLMMIAPAWRKATQWVPRRHLAGPQKRTPIESLGLQPGEWVEIKSAPEIAQTLDARGRNRGLICDYGMCQYSGGKYRVRNRLDRMIAEPTGEMKEVQSTVILEGLKCLCWNVFGGCPRNDFMYWREIWLKRCHPENTRVDADEPKVSAVNTAR